jgi:hypothetical protein
MSFVLDHRHEARLPHAGPMAWALLSGLLILGGLGLLALPLTMMALDDAYRRRLHEIVLVVCLFFMIIADLGGLHEFAPLWSPIFPLTALLMARMVGSFMTGRPGWSVLGLGDFVGVGLLALIFGAVPTCLAMVGSCLMGKIIGHHHHPLLRDMVILLGLISLW